MISFLKNYSFKSLKRYKWILGLMMTGQFIVAALLAVTVFMVDNINAFSSKNARALNHGDMAIEQTNLWFGDEIYKERSKKFENYLASQTDILYTFEQRLILDEDAIINIEGGKTIEGNSYWCRWIDFNYIDRYSIKEVKAPKQSVVISETLAKRLSAKEGNILNIHWGLKGDVLCLPIGSIIPDSEIGIQEANKGYLILDLDFYKKWRNDSRIDFNNAWAKKYYIDSSYKKLTQIEREAEKIFGNDYEITYQDDIPKVAENFFALPVNILSMFTVLCFIISGLSLINLLFIIANTREKDIAILKVYGLSKIKCFIFQVFEVLWMLTLSGVLGILIGYAAFRVLLNSTTSLGIYSLSINLLAETIIKIISIYLLSVLVFIIPYIAFFVLRRPIEVLRDKSFAFKIKYVIPTTCSILLIYNFLTQFVILSSIFIKVIVALGLFYLFFRFIMMAFYIINVKSYLQLGIIFLRNNKTRVPIQMLTYTICFTVLFISILISGSLNSLTTSNIMQQCDYNVKISTNVNKVKIEQFLNKEHITNFYMIYAYSAQYENTLLELQVFDFDNYEGIMKNKISNKINVAEHFSENYGLKSNSVININIKNINTFHTFTIGDNSYNASFMGGQSRAMALSKEGIDFVGEPDRFIYFLNLSKAQRTALNGYIKEQSNILVSDINDIISNATSTIRDCKSMYNIIAIVFFAATFIVILSCTILTYFNRVMEFSIYFTFGANRKHLQKIMLLENITIVTIGTICGTFISYSLFKVISQSLGYQLHMDYLVVVALIIILVLMATVATTIVSKLINIENSNQVFRFEQ